MGEVLIKAENISKKFSKNLKKSLYYGLKDVFAGVFGFNGDKNLREDEFWAVKDISFEVRRGECLGLIGHNGAGKSTLLKMLNGLIRPDKGNIKMRGKVGALIELGAGFSPLLTGRENIYNNGAVLGFTKDEIGRKYNDIVEFAELRDFIDSPVQNYSSGMKVRLGFAIAAQMQPDILLIDEVLAVGDMGFVLKCFNQMDKLLRNTAMVFVSHSMPHVARMCNQILVMDYGKCLINTSDTSEGLAAYYNRFKNEIGDYSGGDTAELKSVNILYDGKIYGTEDNLEMEYGTPFNLEICINIIKKIQKPEIYIVFYDKEQRGFAEILNFNNYSDLEEVEGDWKFQATINDVFLSQGKYSITVALLESGQSRGVLFRYQSAMYFTIKGGFHGWVPVQYNPEWKIIKLK
jgi:lipopolysaccharide transport system ATP-binding protein